MIHPASPILALTAAAALSAPLPRLESLTVSVTEGGGGGGGAPGGGGGAAGPPAGGGFVRDGDARGS